MTIATTDEQLAHRARSGSVDEFEQLVGRYQVRLLNYLQRLSGDRQLAEDLVQESLVRAYRYLGSYDHRRPFRAWLFKIAYRQFARSCRPGRPRAESRGVETVVDYRGRGCTLDAQEIWSAVRERVNDDQFTGIWMMYVESASIAEIARTLGKTQAGTKMMLSRVRSRLRIVLARFADVDKAATCHCFEPCQSFRPLERVA